MFLSAVRTTSNPACSAAASKSPLPSVSHPRSLAVVTVWPERTRAMPLGVTWSNRMSIFGGIGRCQGRRVETSSGKLKYRVDLLARYIELLNDFVYAGSGFKVVEHGGDRHPGTSKHPCAAQSGRHTFYGGAFGPLASDPFHTHASL